MNITKILRFCKNIDQKCPPYCLLLLSEPQTSERWKLRAVKMAASRSKRSQKRSFSPSTAPNTNTAKKKKVTSVGKMPKL